MVDLLALVVTNLISGKEVVYEISKKHFIYFIFKFIIIIIIIIIIIFFLGGGVPWKEALTMSMKKTLE